MHTNLIVDVNNVVFSIRHAKLPKPASIKKKEKFVKEFIFIEALSSVLRHSRMLKSDAIALMRDSKNIWRKDFYPEYKANHVDALEDLYHQETIDAADMLCEFFDKHTYAGVYTYPRAEADDLIGIWCQESTGVNNVILSSDKDFIQLIDERTKLYSHTQDTFRETEDASFSLFVKCIRGDSGDNVRSAYPRITEKKLLQAWNDDLDMLNLLETILPDGTKVADNLAFNVKMIDLTSQPNAMRRAIYDMFSVKTFGIYSQLKCMKYLGDAGLKEHRDIFDQKDRALKKSPVFQID